MNLALLTGLWGGPPGPQPAPRPASGAKQGWPGGQPRPRGATPQTLLSALALLFFAIFAACCALAAAEWSQFRGPNASGVSEATGLPVEFGPEKNVIWKTLLPPGHSPPILGDGRIFITA